MRSPSGWIVALLLGAHAHAQSNAQSTAIDRYVAAKDAVYGWKVVRTVPGDGARTVVLELTSQSWRAESEVDRPVWKHWLTIVRPDGVKARTGLLFIGAGSNRDPAPATASDRSLRIARETGSVVADLGMVPNQPLRFADSPERARSEDDLIAYSRVKHFSTKDDTWLVRLAMVKSGVRAMDAVQEFLASREGGGVRLDKFVVAGASKRGWATWLIGAVDKRVAAIIPMVIDALNSQPVTRHHYEAYGFFAPSLEDYVNHGLFPHKLGTPEYAAVLKIEDPYEHRARPSLRMPKFLINASGDEFFLPDNSQFYYSALPQEKHLRYVPNAKHNLANSNAVESLIAFYDAVIHGRRRPDFSWVKEPDGTLVVRTKDRPMAVRLWQATNPDARDFRLDKIGRAYHATDLAPSKKGVYVGKVAAPPKGATAFFVELEFASGGKHPFLFSTEVSIAPDKLPHRFEDAAKQYESTKR